MLTLVSGRPLAVVVAVAVTLLGSRSGAAPILGTYQAQGVIVELGDSPNYAQFMFGLSLGGTVALNFTLQDVAESATGTYLYSVVSWNVIGAPQFYYLGGPALGGAGSVQLSGDAFDLHVPDGILTFGGTSTGGIQFDYSAIGLAPGSGLRLPTATASWEARVLDPNGQLLLRAKSVPEPPIGLLIGLGVTVAAISAGAGTRRAHQDLRAAG